MSYTHLTLSERFKLYQYRIIDKLTLRTIAAKMGRSPSTISRELRRNRVEELSYLPDSAQTQMQERRQQSKQKFGYISPEVLNGMKCSPKILK